MLSCKICFECMKKFFVYYYNNFEECVCIFLFFYRRGYCFIFFEDF